MLLIAAAMVNGRRANARRIVGYRVVDRLSGSIKMPSASAVLTIAPIMMVADAPRTAHAARRGLSGSAPNHHSAADAAGFERRECGEFERLDSAHLAQLIVEHLGHGQRSPGLR